jgi:hypothetical protein
MRASLVAEIVDIPTNLRFCENYAQTLGIQKKNHQYLSNARRVAMNHGILEIGKAITR